MTGPGAGLLAAVVAAVAGAEGSVTAGYVARQVQAAGRPFTEADATDALVSLSAAAMTRRDGFDRWVPGPSARYVDMLDDDVEREWLLGRAERRGTGRAW